jgi:hypothetical protein
MSTFVVDQIRTAGSFATDVPAHAGGYRIERRTPAGLSEGLESELRASLSSALAAAATLAATQANPAYDTFVRELASLSRKFSYVAPHAALAYLSTQSVPTDDETAELQPVELVGTRTTHRGKLRVVAPPPIPEYIDD